ncbi:MAG: Flp pilus assembly complex ATPase component TadA [Magnetococcales bacterium]|nr:Flp pilus assembly complex ATPase component TadA [Magnetococcales bacterium]
MTEKQISDCVADQPQQVRIGDLMVQQKLITNEQLSQVLDEQKRGGKRIGEAVVQLGFLSEEVFLQFMSRWLEVPLVNLRNFQENEEVIQRIPESIARRFNVLALAEGDDAILVGMTDPTDLFAQDELGRILDKNIKPALISATDLERNLDRYYRKQGEIVGYAEELSDEVGRTTNDLDQMMQTEMLVDAPVVKILNSIFTDAIRVKASDIHIQPGEDTLRIRKRIDGVLYEQVIKEHQIAPALISKIKLMAGLEISEKRLPQDGRFNMKIDNKNIDVRVSTMPIQNGESVVMRLLDHSKGIMSLSEVGLSQVIVDQFTKLLSRPHGMLLVVGPTGSGKTSTLYAAINRLNTPSKNIITIEDPVEFKLPRINQVQIKTKIGLDFTTVLRAILRQDPDIILVGEMRDHETASIAIRAALTGHLILSTLHTNDAVSTAIRLLEMKLPGYAVASSLLGILSQRLVRRICLDCREEKMPDEPQQQWLEAMTRGEPADEIILWAGKGCPNCNNTGYNGRIAVAELLEVNGDLARALRKEDVTAIPEIARTVPTFRPLHLAALDYARQGVTTLEEVIRLSSQEEDEEAGKPVKNKESLQEVPGEETEAVV